jgi:hypothetical protein
MAIALAAWICCEHHEGICCEREELAQITSGDFDWSMVIV